MQDLIKLAPVEGDRALAALGPRVMERDQYSGIVPILPAPALDHSAGLSVKKMSDQVRALPPELQALRRATRTLQNVHESGHPVGIGDDPATFSPHIVQAGAPLYGDHPLVA
jgi:hypothetical protein